MRHLCLMITAAFAAACGPSLPKCQPGVELVSTGSGWARGAKVKALANVNVTYEPEDE